ncbi:MAG: DUF2092 domain-containing protein [Desulfuromusa sp.]|nr:DUF2092 domain-containing protein [Desulfuromusa sp.]
MIMYKVIPKTKWCSLLVVVVLGGIIAVGPAVRAESIDLKADTVLQSMSSYLGGSQAFTFNADIDFEVVATTGQKLQLSSYATAVVQRPAHIYIERKGLVADLALINDGKTLTLHGKNLNIFFQVEGTGTIDDAFSAYEMETGIVAPGADLLFANPYAVLSEGVESSIYIGTTFINGIECHHLAFREAKVDWQLWVQAGDTPLPMKYVITSKWQTAAPQYEIRFRDWNTSPKINDGEFTFLVPEGATRVDVFPLDETGEYTSIEEGQK